MPTDPDIDAVVIATPVFTHFTLAKRALENGKHSGRPVWLAPGAATLSFRNSLR